MGSAVSVATDSAQPAPECGDEISCPAVSYCAVNVLRDGFVAAIQTWPNMTAVLVRAAKLISGIQGSKAPETWHFRGAGSGAGGKRASSRGAEGRIRKKSRYYNVAWFSTLQLTPSVACRQRCNADTCTQTSIAQRALNHVCGSRHLRSVRFRF